MATIAQWIEGARPRTLPNAIAPVLVGTGAAIGVSGFSWWRAGLALVVSLALIVGVNFANDYSDGIRGTDDERIGPLRLVGSKLVAPPVVRVVAFGCFGLAGVAGLVLTAASGQWWLLAVGGLCIAAAWFYTGGAKPYGYAGFGEPAVFLFFGLTGVLGTLYVQAGLVTWSALAAAAGVGSFSAAVLIANNLRDISTDQAVGKRTLAVRLGDRRIRRLYVALVMLPFLMSGLTSIRHPWALLALLAVFVARPATHRIASNTTGQALIPVLRDTALTMLMWSAATGIGLAVGP